MTDSLNSLIQHLNLENPFIRVAVGIMLMLLFWAIYRFIRRLMRRLGDYLTVDEGSHVKSLNIQDQEILSTEDVSKVLSGLLQASGWLAIGVIGLSISNAVLGLFEWSQKLSDSLTDLLLNSLTFIWQSFIDYLPDLVVIFVVLVIMRFILRVLKLVFDGIAHKRISIPGFYPEWGNTSFNLLRLMIYALTIIVIFPYLPGSSSPAFQGMSIFFGVLLSLGSTSAVANVVAGIVLTFTRAFQQGDRVKIASTMGKVAERTMFVTRLETTKHETVSIPNSMVLSGHIVNYSSQAKKRGLILHTAVTIGYDVAWTRVQELLIAAALKTRNVEKKPEPFVLQKALNDYSIHYELNVTTRDPDKMPATYSELHANILDEFNAAGIEIMSPTYLATRDGTGLTIPADPLPSPPGED
jgi:small-conductance mechanosensitive channel